jgi:hypothetical protein
MSVKKVDYMIKDKKEMSQEDKDKISSLQKIYADTIFEIGELIIHKNLIEKTITNINQELEDRYKDVDLFKQKEAELIKELDDKYGLSNLDL